MSDSAPSQSPNPIPAASLDELPADELLRYGSELGISLEPGLATNDMARQIRERQSLLAQIDREALLDIVIWGRRPVRRSATKEHLAREIHRIQQTNYRSLSTRGLAALAKLRNIAAADDDDAGAIIEKLRKQDGVWKRLTCKRRALVGSLLSKIFEGEAQEESTAYRFLPEDPGHALDAGRPSIREHVEQHGFVGGIASRLRGAADDYIRVKLDEIEIRIDQKLDQIDKRLAEWRDREIRNRLKIIRITLIFTVLVALLSLGYNLLKKQVVEPQPDPAPRVVTPGP